MTTLARNDQTFASYSLSLCATRQKPTERTQNTEVFPHLLQHSFSLLILSLNKRRKSLRFILSLRGFFVCLFERVRGNTHTLFLLSLLLLSLLSLLLLLLLLLLSRPQMSGEPFTFRFPLRVISSSFDGACGGRERVSCESCSRLVSS